MSNSSVRLDPEVSETLFLKTPLLLHRVTLGGITETKVLYAELEASEVVIRTFARAAFECLEPSELDERHSVLLTELTPAELGLAYAPELRQVSDPEFHKSWSQKNIPGYQIVLESGLSAVYFMLQCNQPVDSAFIMVMRPRLHNGRDALMLTMERERSGRRVLSTRHCYDKVHRTEEKLVFRLERC